MVAPIMDLDMRCVGACDPKAHALSFDKNKPAYMAATHWWSNLRQMTNSDQCKCQLHPVGDDDQCRLTEREDLLVAGFPCQPYSNKYYKRWRTDNVVNHRFFSVLDDLLLYMDRRRPRKVLLENVKGFLMPFARDNPLTGAEVFASWPME